MIKYITPESIDLYRKDSFKIFFAGTIDNGESENWQIKLYETLLNEFKIDNNNLTFTKDSPFITIFSPRRDNWNKNASDKEVIDQIKWEQEYLDEADLIIMYIGDNSKSPISLLELGLYSQTGKVIVYCTDKFYRYNNVKLTCDKYLVEIHETLDLNEISKRIYKIYTNEIKK